MTKQLLRLAFKSYPTQVLGIFVLSLLQTVVTGIGLSLLMPIIEGLQTPSNVTFTHPLSRFFTNILTYLHLPLNLWVLFISGLTLYTLQTFVQYLRANLVTKTSNGVEAKMRIELLSSLLHTELGYFHQKKVGDLVNSIVTEANRGAAAFIYLINILVTAVLIMAYLVIGILISWKLSLVMFCISVPLIYFSRRRRSIVQKGQEISHANEVLQSMTVESLLGIREIKIFGLEQHLTPIFSAVATNVSRQNLLLQRLNTRLISIYEIAAVGIIILSVSLSVFVLKNPIPEMVAILALMVRLSPMVTNLQNNRDKFLGTMSGFKVVNELLGEARQSKEAAVKGAYGYNRLQSSIDFDNVSFTYEGHDIPVLRNITLRLEQAKTTAIVGASGSGKSTLVDLIVRFYDPTEGQILVDGTDLKQIDLLSWRGMIGFVSQETFLFNDTVLKNIWYGNLQALEEEVVEAARRAYAHEFIMELPQGYHTVIGDRGVRLSGGQRQRLALARAILRNPQVLILDEATSDLDSKSERLIQDSLRELSRNRTVIIIAHRLSTIENADEIVVVEEGRVVESGSHQALLQRRGHYADYYNLQFRKSFQPFLTDEGLNADNKKA